jgi:pSer/pThr/pTyr-binding forkhead associated (FHA) protein
MQLRITENGSASREHEVAPREVTVGRSLECDIVLQQSYVSGRHLRLIDGLVVEDLGSMNGTFLDGAKVEGREVIAGRRLSIGGKDLTLECVHDAGSASALIAEELEGLRRRLDTFEHPGAAGGAGTQRRVPAQQSPDDPWTRLLLELVNNDATRQEPAQDASVAEFYIIQSFKLVRNVETFVTRLAGELVRQFGGGTILPGSDRDHNLRNLLADIIIDPDSAERRKAFVEYQSHLQAWLVVSFNAYKDGGLALVKELRESLRPITLRRQEPIPALYRVSRLEDLILWRRAQKFIEDLSNNYVLDRLDSLACDAANKYIKSKTR